jgi:hypothetical protein
MADIIKFDNKKLDDDDELLRELLEEAEKPGNVEERAGNEKVETVKDNVSHLPKKLWPEIDWDEVESIRMAEYPRIPKKALAIIRMIFENPRDDSYFDFPDSGDAYPPDPVPIRPVLGDAIWIMDLLDRFGGEIRYGDREYVVKRKKKRPAIFLLQPISQITRDALSDSMGHFFEHYLESKKWVIWGKEITDRLMALIVTNRQDEDRIYLGWFDRQTAWVLFRRMKDISIETVLGL